MRIVVALGGNALLQPHQPLSADNLLTNTQLAANALAPLTTIHELILCHGNGPQVGLLAMEDAQYQPGSPYPLDLLVAETEGMIGYPLQQALQNCLPQQKMVTLLTQVLVDEYDPAFQQPTKPIGPYYDEATATQLQTDHGWQMIAVGNQKRRVVPSPKPQAIVEIAAIRELLKSGHLVICAGGGGIPVINERQQRWRGVAAVVDKDYTAACLARQLAADTLLILTDVEAVYQDWGTAQQRAIRQASPQALSQLDFPAGSMAPKIAAACQFVQQGGCVVIGALAQAEKALNGECGTMINHGFDSINYE